MATRGRQLGDDTWQRVEQHHHQSRAAERVKDTATLRLKDVKSEMSKTKAHKRSGESDSIRSVKRIALSIDTLLRRQLNLQVSTELADPQPCSRRSCIEFLRQSIESCETEFIESIVEIEGHRT